MAQLYTGYLPQNQTNVANGYVKLDANTLVADQYLPATVCRTTNYYDKTDIDTNIYTKTATDTLLSGKVNVADVGQANGVCPLDSSGKIASSYLTVSAMEYKGNYDASTNTPSLVNGTGNTGDVYTVSASGSVDFGSGTIILYAGDQVIYDGSVWNKCTTSSSTVSVFGRNGVITAQSGDYSSFYVLKAGDTNIAGCLAYNNVSNTTIGGSNANIINKAYADSNYLSLTTATNDYLTKVDASSNYVKQDGSSSIIGNLRYSNVSNSTLNQNVNNLISKSYGDSYYCLQSLLGAINGIAQLDNNVVLKASQVPVATNLQSLALWTCSNWTQPTPTFTKRYDSSVASWGTTGSYASAHTVVSGKKCDLTLDVQLMCHATEWANLADNDYVMLGCDTLSDLLLPKYSYTNEPSGIINAQGFSEGKINTTNGYLPLPVQVMLVRKSSSTDNGGVYIVLKDTSAPITGSQLKVQDGGKIKFTLNISYEIA